MIHSGQFSGLPAGRGIVPAGWSTGFTARPAGICSLLSLQPIHTRAPVQYCTYVLNEFQNPIEGDMHVLVNLSFREKILQLNMKKDVPVLFH